MTLSRMPSARSRSALKMVPGTCGAGTAAGAEDGLAAAVEGEVGSEAAGDCGAGVACAGDGVVLFAAGAGEAPGSCLCEILAETKLSAKAKTNAAGRRIGSHLEIARERNITSASLIASQRFTMVRLTEDLARHNRAHLRNATPLSAAFAGASSAARSATQNTKIQFHECRARPPRLLQSINRATVSAAAESSRCHCRIPLRAIDRSTFRSASSHSRYGAAPAVAASATSFRCDSRPLRPALTSPSTWLRRLLPRFSSPPRPGWWPVRCARVRPAE